MLKFILLLAGCAMAQTYENPALSAHYEVPAGWVMGKVDSTYFGIHFQVTRVGLKPINMTFEKFPSLLSAYSENGSYGFFMMSDFYNRCSKSTVAPITPYMSDTTYSNGVSSFGLNMRHIALDMHLVCYMASKSYYTQKMCYETTMSDFDANYGLYGQNWSSTSFDLATPTLAKSAAHPSAEIDQRMRLINIMGRQAGPASLRSPTYSIPNRGG